MVREARSSFAAMSRSSWLESVLLAVGADMNRAEVRLAIVVDADAKPLGFITSGDIRRLLYAE